MERSRESDATWPALQLPLCLSPQVVHVVRIRLDVAPARWNELQGILTADERVRAARFRFDEPRRRFIVCRATLRRILGSCCDLDPQAVPLKYGLQGKPEISFNEVEAKLPNIEFSVSHSRDFGLIAITRDAIVGVDIEECNPKVKAQGLAKRFFSQTEAEQLSRLSSEQLLAGFYRGWTCKEAYIKATGRGLSLPLDSFVVMIDPDQPASLLHVDDLPNEPARWSIYALDVADNYAGAVMVARPACQLECWDWPEE